LETYPLQTVRKTINADSIATLSENIIFLHELGFKVSASLAHGVEWNIEINKKQFARELKTLCDYYLNNPTITPCSLLFDMFLPIVSRNQELAKWCGCGTHMVTVDIDGKEYPCQSFLPSAMSVENDWTGVDFLNNEMFSSNECLTCLIKNICPTCYGINLVHNGSISKRDKNLCELNKILALANSYLLGKQIENNIVTFESDSKQFDTIRSILLVQKEYSEATNQHHLTSMIGDPRK
jgi:radical SAM protein with 4Fe4S-binding SPASM domain